MPTRSVRNAQLRKHPYRKVSGCVIVSCWMPAYHCIRYPQHNVPAAVPHHEDPPSLFVHAYGIYRVVHFKICDTRAVCSYWERSFTKLAHAHSVLISIVSLLCSSFSFCAKFVVTWSNCGILLNVPLYIQANQSFSLDLFSPVGREDKRIENHE
jgi:hypothetical protein